MMENLWGIGGVFALLFCSSINLFYKASEIFYYNVKYEEYWLLKDLNFYQPNLY